MYDGVNPYYRVNDIITSGRLNSLLLMADQIHTTSLHETIWDGNNLQFGVQDGNISTPLVDGDEREFSFISAGDFSIALSDLPLVYEWLLEQIKILEDNINSINGLDVIKVNNKSLDHNIVLTSNDLGCQNEPKTYEIELFSTSTNVDTYFIFNCEADSQYNNNHKLIPNNEITFNNTILEVLDITTDHGNLDVKYFNHSGSSINFIIYLKSNKPAKVSLFYKGV